MSESIKGKVTDVGKTNRIAIDNVWYQLTDVAAKFLKYQKIGSDVTATLTGNVIENEIKELSYIKKGEFTEKGEQINTVPLGKASQSDSSATYGEFKEKELVMKQKGILLSYSKDIALAKLGTVEGYHISIPEIVDMAEEFYKFVAKP